MALFILAVIIFVIADLLIRYFGTRSKEKKAYRERAAALDKSLKLDFSREAESLKRVEVSNPNARILCVDDEEVILDSFRKILVMGGYSVDTIMNGKEALGLVQTHNYDFVFTDLKMPEMDGVEVTKSIKHLRPDIDIIIITGYGTVETAVETMKYGAMDYIEKPFTEDELLDFTNKSLIRRQDRIKKHLKPKVFITYLADTESLIDSEFAIPGGVFISEDHCWVSMDQTGAVKIGFDDFTRKLIGKIDNIEFPNLGMNIKRGRSLFSIGQRNRIITFASPVSGLVSRINTLLSKDLGALDITPYYDNWICIIDADNLDNEIKQLKIGKSAVTFYQEDIEHLKDFITGLSIDKKEKTAMKTNGEMHLGEIEGMDDSNWEKAVAEFFKRHSS
ncbi:MAG: response regulator [Ignavibacteriaceae bacterium]|jgi:DNA-binding response OmpR family regulator